MVSVTPTTGMLRRLGVSLRLGGDGGNGLLVVYQDLDLPLLDLVFRFHDSVRGRVVSLRDCLLELERREDFQSQGDCLIEKDGLGEADRGARLPAGHLGHLLPDVCQGLLENPFVPDKHGGALGKELLEAARDGVRDCPHVVDVVPDVLVVRQLVRGDVEALQNDTRRRSARPTAACPSSRRSRRRSRSRGPPPRSLLRRPRWTRTRGGRRSGPT